MPEGICKKASETDRNGNPKEQEEKFGATPRPSRNLVLKINNEGIAIT
jgi:hypothetical protein